VPVVLPWLLDLSFWLFAIGCLIFLTLCVLIVKALFGTASSAVSWIPWVGSAAASGLHKAEQHVVNVFTVPIEKTQAALGWSWHLQARLIDWLGREINSHANLLLTLASVMPGVGFVTQIYHDLLLAKQAVARLLHTVTHLHGSVVNPLARELTQLNRWTHTRVKALDHAIDVTIPKDIAGLRTRTKTIEGELARLWKAIRTNEAALATTAFVGAVALAMSRLGMGWLRCNTATQFGKKYGCSAWTRLDELLGLLGGALLITNICAVIPLIEEAFTVVAAPLIGTLSGVGAGLCSPGSSAADPLTPPQLYLPASPSDSLYLP
jgi:hypothetical protein